MLDKLFPTEIFEALKNNLKFNYLYEIRLRIDRPITINYSNKFYFLGIEGLTTDENNAIICSKNLLESVILKASNYSIYSVNEDIKKGFITLNGGIRLGICGEIVTENGYIKTMKDFSSINLRFPHEVRNCSLNVLNYLIDNGQVLNTLVISSPCGGKTTFIRDICYQLGKSDFVLNVLILDERNEISASIKGVPTMDVGKFSDILVYSNKKIGFENGIRSMSPNLIVADELGNREDIESIIYASNSGINLLASAHAKNIEELKEKYLFNDVLHKKIFKRIVVLSQKNGAGTIEGVFDENLVRLVWNTRYLG